MSEGGGGIIRHAGVQRGRRKRGKSSLHDLEQAIDGWRAGEEGGWEEQRTPVPPKTPYGEDEQPRPAKYSSMRDDLEAKIEQYRRQMTQQDQARDDAKQKLERPDELTSSKHPSAGMEPHSARKATRSTAAGSAGHVDPTTDVQPKGGGLGRSTSGKRITLAVTMQSDKSGERDEQGGSGDPDEPHVLPQELLGYRDPAAALFRIGLSTLRRLEMKGTVRKAMRHVRQIDAGQSSTAQSAKSLHGLVKLMLAIVGHEDSFDDFEQLVEDGQLSDALQVASGQLQTTLSRKLLAQVNEFVGSRANSKETLRTLLAQHEKSPTVASSLCCWLYGKLLEVDPQKYALTAEQALVWNFLNLQPSLREQDQRLSICEVWAREQVDALRHLPKATLREILLRASCSTVCAGQRVRRVGQKSSTISIIFAGSLSAMVAGLDAHEQAKLVASQVVHTLTSSSTTMMHSQMEVARSLGRKESSREWMRKWQEALAKGAAQRLTTKFKTRKAREKSKEKVPLAIGPYGAIGQSAAISYSKFLVASKSLDHTIATNARSLKVKEVQTTIEANATTLMMQIEEPQHVIAIEEAMEADQRWKFEKLFSFEGLRACSCDALQALVQRVSKEVIRKGETLFSIGDQATELFFVVSGALEVTVPRSDGTINRIATVGAGATFGSFPEVVAMRQATVTAKDDAEVLSVHLYNFHNAMATLQTDINITDYGTADRFRVMRSALRASLRPQLATVVSAANRNASSGDRSARPATSVHSAREYELPARPSTSGHSSRYQMENEVAAGGFSSSMAQTTRNPPTAGPASISSQVSPSVHQLHMERRATRR